MKWSHSRKGEIEGEIIHKDGDWVTIQLTEKSEEDMLLAGFSVIKGKISVRKSLLTET